MVIVYKLSNGVRKLSNYNRYFRLFHLNIRDVFYWIKIQAESHCIQSAVFVSLENSPKWLCQRSGRQNVKLFKTRCESGLSSCMCMCACAPIKTNDECTSRFYIRKSYDLPQAAWLEASWLASFGKVRKNKGHVSNDGVNQRAHRERSIWTVCVSILIESIGLTSPSATPSAEFSSLAKLEQSSLSMEMKQISF